MQFLSTIDALEPISFTQAFLDAISPTQSSTFYLFGNIYAPTDVCVKDIDSWVYMVLQNCQNFIELTLNMISIVALGIGLKCPRKIHLNTQCPPPLFSNWKTLHRSVTKYKGEEKTPSYKTAKIQHLPEDFCDVTGLTSSTL